MKQPEPGDIAWHRSGRVTQPRTVVKVRGSKVWLTCGAKVWGPLPAKNYTFEKGVS